MIEHGLISNVKKCLWQRLDVVKADRLLNTLHPPCIENNTFENLGFFEQRKEVCETAFHFRHSTIVIEYAPYGIHKAIECCIACLEVFNMFQ